MPIVDPVVLLEVIKHVREAIPGIKAQLPVGMKVGIPYDSTAYIQDAINEVLSTLTETLLIEPSDLHAPSVLELAEFVDALHARLVAGERLVINCGAGIGRAGTVATALLMRTGMSRVDALATVRAHRPMAGPESGTQSEVLEAFELHLR